MSKPYTRKFDMQLIFFLVLLNIFSVELSEMDEALGIIGAPNIVDENYIIARALKPDPNELFCDHELEQLFDAFEKNNSAEVEEMYKVLENMEYSDETNNAPFSKGVSRDIHTVVKL